MIARSVKSDSRIRRQEMRYRVQFSVARDWDEHYADPANRNWEPEPLLVEAAEFLAPGRALDLACGTGRNALYLVSLGWRVTAVDRSPADNLTRPFFFFGLPMTVISGSFFLAER